MGLALGSIITTLGTAAGLGVTQSVNLFFALQKPLAIAAARIVGGLLLNAATNALFGRRPGAQQDLKREIRLATSLLPKRFAYGSDRVPGSEIPGCTRGDTFYMVYLFNSRPSEIGAFTLYVDNRAVVFSGDPYDFAGPGASAVNGLLAGHLRFWIGRGDQTSCPAAFVNEAGAGTDGQAFRSTDAFSGCTVVFCAFKAGDNNARLQRWPSSIPLVDMSGIWSKIWDPNNPAHSLSDPATWSYSDNAALIALDALTQCPFRPYSEGFLEMPQWQQAAVVAADKGYKISGVVSFGNGELEQIVQPLFEAQAANPIRVAGRLGISFGDEKTIAGTITDTYGNFGASSFAPNPVTRLEVSYSSDARGGEPASLSPYDIPGAVLPASGLPSVRSVDMGLVSDPVQAQNLREVIARREVHQKVLSFVGGPEAIEFLPGSWVDLDLTGVFASDFNGTYEVQAMTPVLNQQEGGGFSLLWDMKVREVPANLYDPPASYENIENPERNYEANPVAPPGLIGTLTGPEVNLDSGGTILTRIRFEANPSTSSGVIHYQWEIREHDPSNGPESNWGGGGTIPAGTLDAEGDIYGFTSSVDPTKSYDIRIRTIAALGASIYQVREDIGFGFELSAVTATSPATGAIEYTFSAPGLSNFAGVRVRSGAVGSAFQDAGIVAELIGVNAGETATVTVSGLSSGQYDFWISPVNATGSEGAVTGPDSITIT